MAERGTTCWKGLHDLTDPGNVIDKADGSRQCKPCNTAAKLALYERKRFARHGGPTPPRGIQRDDCEVDGCGRPRSRCGETFRQRYCPGHYSRKAKYGELFEEIPIGTTGGVSLPLLRRRMIEGGADSAHCE